MRKSLWLLAALAPLAVAGFSLPATADSGEGGCVAAPDAANAGPIDLEKIPAKPVTGVLAVNGGGECDDVGVVGERAELEHHDGTGHEASDLDD